MLLILTALILAPFCSIIPTSLFVLKNTRVHEHARLIMMFLRTNYICTYMDMHMKEISK